MASPEERERIMAEYLAQQQQEDDDDDDELDDRVIDEDDDDDDDDDEADFEPGGDDDEEEDDGDGDGDDDGDDDELPLMQGALKYDHQKHQLIYQGCVIMGNSKGGSRDGGQNTFLLSSSQPLHFDLQEPTRSEPVTTVTSPTKSTHFPPSARIIDMCGQLDGARIGHLQFTISIPKLLKSNGYDDDDDGGGKRLASSTPSNHRHGLKHDDDDDNDDNDDHFQSKRSGKFLGKHHDESSFSVHAVGILESGRGLQFQGQLSLGAACKGKAKGIDDDGLPLVCQLRYDEEISKVATPSAVAKSPPVAAASAAKRRYADYDDDDDDDDGEEEEADEGIDYDELIELHKDAGTPIDQVVKRRRRQVPDQPLEDEHQHDDEDGDDDDDDDDYKEEANTAEAFAPSSKKAKQSQEKRAFQADEEDDDDDDVGF
jgi:hypothetical protein